MAKEYVLKPEILEAFDSFANAAMSSMYNEVEVPDPVRSPSEKAFEWISRIGYTVTRTITLPIIAFTHGFITAIRDCMEMANDQ